MTVQADLRAHIHPDFYGVNVIPPAPRIFGLWDKVGHFRIPNMSIMSYMRTIDYALDKIREISGVDSIEWVYNHSLVSELVTISIYCDMDLALVDAVCRMAFVGYISPHQLEKI